MSGRKGRSGRSIIPDDIKEAIGYRKDRINHDRPAVVCVDFRREQLGELAQSFFDYYFQTLRSNGVLSDTDAFAFNHLCRVFEQLCIAEDALCIAGQTQISLKGGARVSSEWRVYKELSEMYMKLLREFGLTPVSRSSIQVRSQEAIDVTPKKQVGKPSPGRGYARKNMD